MVFKKAILSPKSGIKVLPINLPRVIECATTSSVNNATKLIKTEFFQTFLPFCVQYYSFLIFFEHDSTFFFIKNNICQVPTKTCLLKVAFVKYQLKIIARSFSL